MILTRLIVAAAALLPGAAHAQVPTSTQDIIPSTRGPSRSDVAQSDQALRDIAACVIRYHGPRTRNLLATIPGTRDEAIILSSFHSRMETCYNAYRTGARALMIQNNLVRGIFAETHFAGEFPRGIGGAALPEEAASAWARPRPSGDTITQMEMLHAMARCVTARQPSAVNAMLRAAPLSAAERAAMRTLQPDLAACLDSGVEFTASRQALRGVLAEAAYHFAEAQRDGFAQRASSAGD